MLPGDSVIVERPGMVKIRSGTLGGFPAFLLRAEGQLCLHRNGRHPEVSRPPPRPERMRSSLQSSTRQSLGCLYRTTSICRNHLYGLCGVLLVAPQNIFMVKAGAVATDSKSVLKYPDYPPCPTHNTMIPMLAPTWTIPEASSGQGKIILSFFPNPPPLLPASRPSQLSEPTIDFFIIFYRVLLPSDYSVPFLMINFL